MPLRLLLCLALVASAALTAGCSGAENANSRNAANANTANANTANANANANTSTNANASTNTNAGGSSGNSNSANAQTANAAGSTQNSGGAASHTPKATPTPRLSASPLPTGTPAPRGDNSVDSHLNSSQVGEVAFNSPEKMMLDETVNIEVKLGGSKWVEQLGGLIKEKGKIETHPVEVWRVMDAQLVGVGFEIVSITPTRQAISESKPTGWKWQVKATQEGRQELHLTLSAVTVIDGGDRQHSNETFKKDILVEVTSGRRASAFFYNNLSWIVPLLITLVGGLGLRQRFARRRDNPPPPVPPAE